MVLTKSVEMDFRKCEDMEILNNIRSDSVWSDGCTGDLFLISMFVRWGNWEGHVCIAAGPGIRNIEIHLLVPSNLCWCKNGGKKQSFRFRWMHLFMALPYTSLPCENWLLFVSSKFLNKLEMGLERSEIGWPWQLIAVVKPSQKISSGPSPPSILQEQTITVV